MPERSTFHRINPAADSPSVLREPGTSTRFRDTPEGHSSNNEEIDDYIRGREQPEAPPVKRGP